MRERTSGNTGALIASLIIVIILLVGGYFVFRNNPVPTKNIPIPSDGYTQPTEAISQPSIPPQESTEISDIAADAAAIDLTPLDTGLENLDLLVQQ